MVKKAFYISISFFLLLAGSSNAQSLPVGMLVLEDAHRREQLLGHTDSLVSFTIRPLFTGSIEMDKGLVADTVREDDSFTKFSTGGAFANGTGIIQLLPATLNHQYNSRIPYGWNDGSMIQAAGDQTQLILGAYMKVGPVSLQLKPELISAENKDYEGLPTDHADIVWAKYYAAYFNVTDIPERFGEKAYTKLFWGQSSLRVNFDPVSVGVSSENLYWGPGMRGSLIMSNNAPGFKHITVNTTRPVQTSIGSFEAQMVVGKLENSDFLPPEPNRIYEGRSLYIPKDDDARYLSGLVLTYNPKGFPGLFLGASRTSQVYDKNMGTKAGDFFPLLQFFQKNDPSEQREYLSSFFFRWLWKEEMAEIYGEYGHNAPVKLKNFLLDPDVTASFLFGLRKLVPLNKRSREFLQLGMEFIQLQQATVPTLGGWYTSSKIRQGYTNGGQLMGAGIGPGSNLQSLNISWVKGIKQVGFQFERYLHNNDLFYQVVEEVKDYRKHWVDMSYTLLARWDFKNLIASADFTMARTMNYHYVLFNRPPEYFVPGWDFLNYQLKLGITYRF